MAVLQKANSVLEYVKKGLIESYKGDPDLAESVILDIHIKRCRLADHDHYKENRVYSHVMHEDDHTAICCSSSIDILDRHNIEGILIHEIGHLIHAYHPDMIDDVEEHVGDLGLDIDNDTEMQYYEGVEVDQEIMADVIIWKLFGVHIFYDENKVQWAGPFG